MLPSKQRLSRIDFTSLLSSKDLKVVFNNIGTLKYQEGPYLKVSVVISSKIEKRAVYRNKLRRRLYTLFGDYFKDVPGGGGYILYVSKNSPNMTMLELRSLIYELLEKATK
jgi:ribonuclease P protein component